MSTRQSKSRGASAVAAEITSNGKVAELYDKGKAALAILEAAHRALSPGGRLLIAEPMAGTRGAEAMGDAYFGFYLWAMGSGRPRTADELSAMTRDAGFSRCREYRTAMPLLVRVLVAER